LRAQAQVGPQLGLVPSQLEAAAKPQSPVRAQLQARQAAAESLPAAAVTSLAERVAAAAQAAH
jgi:hypothetical protein